MFWTVEGTPQTSGEHANFTQKTPRTNLATREDQHTLIDFYKHVIVRPALNLKHKNSFCKPGIRYTTNIYF